MGYVLIADDGTDAAAPARRAAARPAHLLSIRAAAEAGQLVMSGPRMPDDHTTTGSLQVFEASEAEMDAYMAQEPFATEGVWQRTEILPFRIAPLPWPPQPGRPGGPAGPRFAYAVIAFDGTDAACGPGISRSCRAKSAAITCCSAAPFSTDPRGPWWAPSWCWACLR
jgi:uncharacterized protein YciI